MRVIAESDAVQEFLTDSDDSSNPSPVDLKVNMFCNRGGTWNELNRREKTKSFTMNI